MLTRAHSRKWQSLNLNPCFFCHVPCDSNLQWVTAWKILLILVNTNVLKTKIGNKSGIQGETSSCIKTLPPTNMETAYFQKNIYFLSHSHSLENLANNWHLKSNLKRQHCGERICLKNKANLVNWHRKNWFLETRNLVWSLASATY